VIPGGGLNSTVAGLATHLFNPFDEFKGEFRVIAADLRNAKGGQSTGPLEVDRPWDAEPDTSVRPIFSSRLQLQRRRRSDRRGVRSDDRNR
jgi:hypothetical protein